MIISAAYVSQAAKVNYTGSILSLFELRKIPSEPIMVFADGVLRLRPEQ